MLRVFNNAHPTMWCELLDVGTNYYVVNPIGPDVQRFIGGFTVAVPKWEWTIEGE